MSGSGGRGVPRPYPGDVAPDTADAEFWAACRQGRYLLMRCGTCGRAVWPAGACLRHGMAAMAWADASGRGTLVTWTVVHQRYATSFAGAPPNVALVELDEGPIVHATVTGADPLEVGMRLEVAFEEIGPDVTVPVFRPRRGAEPGAEPGAEGGSRGGRERGGDRDSLPG